jgi:hypothetical protein
LSILSFTFLSSYLYLIFLSFFFSISFLPLLFLYFLSLPISRSLFQFDAFYKAIFCIALSRMHIRVCIYIPTMCGRGFLGWK